MTKDVLVERIISQLTGKELAFLPPCPSSVVYYTLVFFLLNLNNANVAAFQAFISQEKLRKMYNFTTTHVRAHIHQSTATL